MKRAGFPVVMYIALVFASGLLVGGFSYHLYSVNRPERHRQRPGPEDFRRRYVQEMTTRLKLSPEQISSLEQILDQSRARFDEVRKKSWPEMRAIQTEQIARINAILNDTQRAEYAKMREERDRRMKSGAPRKPGP